jgi:hypothetical protein
MRTSLFVLLVVIAVLQAQTDYGYIDGIAASQVGYRPDDSKIAVFMQSNAPSSLEFTLIDQDNSTAFTGTMKFWGDKWTKKYYHMDFSALRKPGTYRLRSNGYTSYPFTISDDVWRTKTHYKEYFTSFFSYQRCTEAKSPEEDHIKAYIRVANDGAPISQNIYKDCRFGSFSSSSTDKHTTIHARATKNLMWAYLQNPAMFNAQLVNGLPAILDEAKWGLSFILKMQDSDGSQCMSVHPGRKSYQQDTNIPLERHVFVNKGTGIAARAFGSFALGYSVFKKIDPSFAGQLLAAARKSAAWIAKNPSNYLPTTIEAGYLDGRFDSRILAAVEMYIALKDEYPTEAQTYKTFVESSIETGTMKSNGVWDSDGAGADYGSGDQLQIGDIVYALCRYHPYAAGTIQTKIESSLTTFFDYYKNRRTNPFGWLDDIMKTYFGACGWMAEIAPKFIMAGKLLNNPEVAAIGTDLVQVDFGMNPFHRTYVYGEGTNTFPDLYGRPASGSIGAVVPGFQVYNGDPAYPIDNYRLDNSPPWTTGEACSPYTPGIVMALAFMDTQIPFVKQAVDLPGRIQAENYRVGGEGNGYHDLTAGNTGGAYRTNAVDIELTTDAGGGYDVGWIDPGEWLSYDVNVRATGIYDLMARVASATSGTKTMAIAIDGVKVGAISTTTSSGWQSWVNATVNDVKLTVGQHVLRISTTTGGFNLNYLNVTPAGAGVVLFATNCGGNAVSGDDGVWYAADKNFSGGSATSTTSPIANTSDDELYQSARQGDCSYAISGFAEGTYVVTLKFSEKYWTTPGKRIFDIIKTNEDIQTIIKQNVPDVNLYRDRASHMLRR